ncbi:MAG: sigma-54-dependent Fis family transcriptional regulator [Candidatus Omnitrophica bacterium]|nr:sigma-54-dependent Fis family transcriptional regulator [Candidatus Omnitrophota bacterium]
MAPHENFETLKAITAIAEANPFGHERPELEADFLGGDLSRDPLHALNTTIRGEITHQVAVCLRETLDLLSDPIRESPERFDGKKKALYRNGVWFWIYHAHHADLDRHLDDLDSKPEDDLKISQKSFDRFREDIGRYLILSSSKSSLEDPLCANSKDVADLFAFCFQLRRAVRGILSRVVGDSESVIRLRCSIWEAIFTRRLLWSFQYLKDRMSNFSTLILGPSGTGKDLVAEFIGKSQFIPFNPDTLRFEINPNRAYRAVNLAALTPTLIESELFGHLKGAFTGASSDRKGHLELCSPYGALFLDEIGDLSPEVQVKLLRVLQSREFYPLGGEKVLRFQGRILSATNRDIGEIVGNGQMREDFLYRIGANVIHVPSLAERFDQRPEEADLLLAHILIKVLGREDSEVYSDVRERIRRLLLDGYRWPGNVREFEQCIRSLLISSDFRPLVTEKEGDENLDDLYRRMDLGEAKLDEVLKIYCSRIVREEGTYRKAATKLGVDWRTIKKHIGSGKKEGTGR